MTRTREELGILGIQDPGLEGNRRESYGGVQIFKRAEQRFNVALQN